MFYIRRKIKYTLRRNVGFLRLTTVFEGSREEWKGGTVTYSSSVNWLAPMSKDIRKIDEGLMAILDSLPYLALFNGRGSAEGDEEAEHLLVGDPVTVSSKWSRLTLKSGVTRCYCSLEVRGPKGNVLGTEKCLTFPCEYGSSYGASEIDPVLACILPHLKATLWGVTPLSLCKNKNVAGPKLVVRFDGKPFDVSRLVREVHSVLKKEPKLRGLSTVGIGE